MPTKRVRPRPSGIWDGHGASDGHFGPAVYRDPKSSTAEAVSAGDGGLTTAAPVRGRPGRGDDGRVPSTAPRPPRRPRTKASGNSGASRLRPGTAATTSAAKHMVLIVYGLAALFPLVLLVSTSLRSQALVNSDPFGVQLFTWSNFSTAWTAGNFSTYLINSVLLTVPSTLLVVVLSTMAGYAYARLRFPFRTPLFYVTIFGFWSPFLPT